VSLTATVVAFANQKGGVGKTTTTLSVAAGMAELGRAVLVVDLDPQACLTFSLGYDPDQVEPSLNDTVVGRATLARPSCSTVRSTWLRPTSTSPAPR
jgi:chromosome partitioning protein